MMIIDMYDISQCILTLKHLIAYLLHSFCGALLFIQCRTANTHDVSWIFFITMLCDIVESGSFNYALNQYPEHLSSKIMTAASIANQMKWISFGIGGVILVGLLMNNHILGRSKAKAHQK